MKPSPGTVGDMTITVRRVSFQFPDSLDDVLPGRDRDRESYLVAFSLTMPALEPYLIRTMRAVSPKVTDEQLSADLKAFIGQEAQHFQNHRRVNEMVLRQLGEPAASRISAILDELEADYQRYTKERSDRFNLAYAEGFEAMTCAMALTMFEQAASAAPGEPMLSGEWANLWAWHAAEEIEHRTVAFNAYEHVVGSYPYRSTMSLRAQIHFQRFILRLQREVLGARNEKLEHRLPPWVRRPEGRRRYLNTFKPRYDPAALEPNELIDVVLSRYTP
jgi:predicted metal-dependent hydrolase